MIGEIKNELCLKKNAIAKTTTIVHCCAKMAQTIFDYPHKIYDYVHDRDGKTINHYWDVSRPNEFLEFCPFCGYRLYQNPNEILSDSEIYNAYEREKRKRG